jgi:cobaltochelatase CobS
MAEENGKIVCLIDNAETHSIQLHIKKNHPDWTIDRYTAAFPGAPLLSKHAESFLAKERKKTEAETAEAAAAAKSGGKQALGAVFGLGRAKAAMNARGEPIMISVFDEVDDEIASFVPDVDQDYVFDIPTLKNFIVGFELGMPMLAWGYHGTGKTTFFEQIAARTRRAFIRIQHTANTEESHVVGQYVVRDGATVWQNGPLVQAMLYGATYCADEYDFALPNVTAVYQPVLEGKPLIIKEAPPELRVVRPHPNFRFVATGNTNGAGDETGLYQGTQIQNAANYSRFGVTVEVGYPEEKVEKAIIVGKSGISDADAGRFVSFAKNVREAFANGKIGQTISPRELIIAAKLGRVRGSEWRLGLGLAFANRLSRIDREVIDGYSQRIFG